ncbi:MAG: hypothetical protein ABI647_19950, partial [Gemmatimonadota bacterium]
MKTVSRILPYAALVLAAAACHPDEIVNSEPTTNQPGIDANIVHLTLPGDQAFAQECATCHPSRDGFDLRYFSYTDTNIVRRAVAHVDTATAWRIASYIRTLQTPKVAENTRLFQPGNGLLLPSDTAFAVRLFGSDQWPVTMTRAKLLAINPLTVPIALDLPQWSNEADKTLEWIPKTALPAAILSFNGNKVKNALATLEATPSAQTLSLAMQAVFNASNDASNPAAPCPYLWRKTPPDYNACFSLHTYASSLGAAYMIRRGLTGFVDQRVHNIWWETGFTAHLSRQAVGPLQVPEARAAAERWFYLGWMFDPVHVQAIYTTGLLRERQRNRLATFVAARSLVARLPGVFDEDVNPYVDFAEVALSTPDNWAVNTGTFALNELRRRLQAGDRPPKGTVANEAKAHLNAGMAALARKIGKLPLAPLQTLANQVIVLVGQTGGGGGPLP